MSLPARALTVSAVAAFVVAAFLFAWWAADVLLVVFAGIIVALALRGAAEWLATRTRMPPAIAVAVVVLGVVALLAFAGWGLADEVARQFTELAERLPRAVREVADRIERTSWGQLLLARLPDTQSVVSPTVVSRATGALTATLGVTAGALANVVIVVFIAVYASLDPGVYRRGIVRMVPGRRRAEQVLHVLAVTLRRWFVGRLVAMVIIGSLTALGLWLVAVPLALTLGLLAGLLNFVPYIGPLVSFVPAALLALVEGPTMLAWVGVLYVAVQTIRELRGDADDRAARGAAAAGPDAHRAGAARGCLRLSGAPPRHAAHRGRDHGREAAVRRGGAGRGHRDAGRRVAARRARRLTLAVTAGAPTSRPRGARRHAPRRPAASAVQATTPRAAAAASHPRCVVSQNWPLQRRARAPNRPCAP